MNLNFPFFNHAMQSRGSGVSNPCVVMLKKEGKTLRISVSDPTHKLDQIQLSLSGDYEIDDNQAMLKKELKKSILKITLPKDGEAGKTVSLNLKSHPE